VILVIQWIVNTDALLVKLYCAILPRYAPIWELRSKIVQSRSTIYSMDVVVVIVR
jgi:hypothetical protein